jgi:hypothetical protein
VVRYVLLPQDGVDIDILHDATRREARGGWSWSWSAPPALTCCFVPGEEICLCPPDQIVRSNACMVGVLLDRWWSECGWTGKHPHLIPPVSSLVLAVTDIPGWVMTCCYISSYHMPMAPCMFLVGCCLPVSNAVWPRGPPLISCDVPPCLCLVMFSLRHAYLSLINSIPCKNHCLWPVGRSVMLNH